MATAIVAVATAAALTGLANMSPSAGIPLAGTGTAPPGSTPAPGNTASPGTADTARGPLGGVSVLLLGDSLAAGEGAGNYFNGTDEPHQRCHRSASGWFAGTGADISNVACSRAIVRNLQSPQQSSDFNARAEAAQLDAMSGQSPDVTVVMLGGNDIRFADIFNQCVLSDADCTADLSFTAGALQSAESVSGSLAGAYRNVAARAAGKPVLVPAYPQLFDAVVGDCGRISPAEAGFARQLTATLNASAQRAAQEASMTYPQIRFIADTENALEGHGACDAQPYVHTVLPASLLSAAQEQSAAQELLHPTAEGYKRLTEAVIKGSPDGILSVAPKAG
ncbi:SGNH/GDSL hydrolase family protein [Pseudarthrobacter sp. NPDC058196]|uniref:SGNH/GDSL hydrolase family protein n=1 Tax=Pseudarthrobacter sp. NPDC058196 TaxID=3346376 RepID=UPI0036DBBED5